MARRPNDRRWLKMGVELEGSWDLSFRDVAATVKDAHGKTDGSVHDLGGNMGEIITRPHTVIEHLCADVTKLYPNRVNGTCGFHIHTSFTPMDTGALTDKPFWEYYKLRWKAWGEAHGEAMGKDVRELFWLRWNGRKVPGADRNYCSMEFKPVDQLTHHNDRYTALNFVAYSKFKTIESRMLPMFTTAEIACAAIVELSDIYDSYLNKVGYPEIKLHREFKTEGDVLVEDMRMELPPRAYWEESFTERDFAKVESGDDVYYHVAGSEGLMLPWAATTTVQEP